MPNPAILLILLSAFIHAFWNLIGKRSHPSAAFFLAASLTTAILLAPLLWIFRSALSAIPGSVWVLLVLTGCAQAVYYSALAGAYRLGDLSLVYPIVRALPVLLVALISILLGRGDQISLIGISGMGLIVAGCLLVPMHRFKLSQFGRASGSVMLLVGLAALGTTGYLLADDAALRLLRNTNDLHLQPFWIPWVYLGLQTVTTTLILTLFVRFNRRERSDWHWVRHTSWRSASLTGLVISGGYLLVLIAMQLAKDISYLTAFRQVSIPIGAFLGILVLKEPAYRPKLVGVGVILCGLVLVGLG